MYSLQLQSGSAREIETSRGSEARLKQSERTRNFQNLSFSLSFSLSLSLSLFASIRFFPAGRAQQRAPAYVGNVSRFSRVVLLHTRAGVAECPLFSFSLLPPVRRWFSPYIYLTAPPDHGPPLPPAAAFAALAYSRAARTLRLHYTGSFPPRSGVSSK